MCSKERRLFLRDLTRGRRSLSVLSRRSRADLFKLSLLAFARMKPDPLGKLPFSSRMLSCFPESVQQTFPAASAKNAKPFLSFARAKGGFPAYAFLRDFARARNRNLSSLSRVSRVQWREEGGGRRRRVYSVRGWSRRFSRGGSCIVSKQAPRRSAREFAFSNLFSDGLPFLLGCPTHG